MFELEITMLGYWLAGTGRGTAGSLDEKALIDESGIPFVPGKHLKGLLKSGLRSWGDKTNTSDESLHIKCFGTDSDNVDEESNKTESGVLRVSSATFEPMIYEKIKNNKKNITALFKQLSSTKINQSGVAESKNLRTIQVVIPVTLYAQLDWNPSSIYANDEIKKHLEDYIKLAIAMTPAIGGKRNRGLGRCKISVSKLKNNEGE